MQAVILSIGDELVLGQTLDTNSAWLSSQLTSLGIDTRYHQTVADVQSDIAAAIDQAARAAELLLITGGLGPTPDDLTRQALADAMKVELVSDPQSLRAISQRMARVGRVMADNNKLQALHPRGSVMIPNHHGTAPGIKARLHQADVYVMPGPPGEMHPMFDQAVLPALQAQPAGRSTILTAKLNTFGWGESTVAQALGDLLDRKRNPLIGTTVSKSIVAVRLRSVFDDPHQARRELDDSCARVREKLGAIVFGEDDQTIEQSLLAHLVDMQQTVVTAESCTGGLIGKRLTDPPGASAVYLGGFVTYSNQMKHDQLGVPMSHFDEYGAVSEPVARAMASGALERSGATYSIAVTGVAGPDGGTTSKPTGSVWIALGHRTAGDIVTHAMLFHFTGGREMVRDRAAKAGLQLLRLLVLGEPLDQITVGQLSPGHQPK